VKKLLRTVGIILCAAAGVLMAASILDVVEIGTCGDIGEQVCPPAAGTDAMKIFGGMLLLFVGAALTRGAGVFVGVLAAGVTLLVTGHGTLPTIIGVTLIAVTLVLLLTAAALARSAGTRAAAFRDFKARIQAGPREINDAIEPMDATDIQDRP
jgi:hypothetical protein